MEHKVQAEECSRRVCGDAWENREYQEFVPLDQRVNPNRALYRAMYWFAAMQREMRKYQV
jgi:hypothetical protein